MALHVQHQFCEVLDLIDLTPRPNLRHVQLLAWKCLYSVTQFVACSLSSIPSTCTRLTLGGGHAGGHSGWRRHSQHGAGARAALHNKGDQ